MTNQFTCFLQLHLYDLVAVRQQQLGTAQPLRRTQRCALQPDITSLASPFTSPAKLTAVMAGKENALTHNQLGSAPGLMLPVHAGQTKQAAAGSATKDRGDAQYAAETSYGQHGVEPAQIWLT